MTQNKHIALFGGDSKTGKEILFQALSLGYHVTTLVHSNDTIEFSNPNLTVIEGNPMVDKDVCKTLANATIVMITLNISISSSLSHSSIIKAPDLFRISLRNIIENMKQNYIERVISLSAWGVYDSYDDINQFQKFLINYSRLGVAIQGHEEQEKKLRESELQWTAVRSVQLKSHGYQKGLIVRHKNKNKLKTTVGRKDVARFMIDIINKPEYYQQTPAISNC